MNNNLDLAKSTQIVFLLTVSLVLAGCLQRLGGPNRTPTEHCGLATEDVNIEADTDSISVWARAYGQWCWRAFLPVVATLDNAASGITVATRAIETPPHTYRHLFEQAAAAGEAPDIIHLTTNGISIAHWADENYIVPLDDCLSKHSVFADIRDEVLEQYRWEGSIWAIPVEIHTDILFFSKSRLKELGWRDAEIDELPLRIKNREISLNDLLAIGKQAERLGIVRSGFGLWFDIPKRQQFQIIYTALGGQLYQDERPELNISQEVLAETFAILYELQAGRITLGEDLDTAVSAWGSSLIQHDAEAHGRVLFWIAPNVNHAMWLTEFATQWNNSPDNFATCDEDAYFGEQCMDNSIGYALIPYIGESNAPFAWWRGSGFYAIVSEEASGRFKQKESCTVLAQSLASDEYLDYLAYGAAFSVLEPQSGHLDNSSSRFLKETEYMAEHLLNLPAVMSIQGQYEAVIVEGIKKAESGDISPEDAAVETIIKLRREFGANVITDTTFE